MRRIIRTIYSIGHYNLDPKKKIRNYVGIPFVVIMSIVGIWGIVDITPSILRTTLLEDSDSSVSSERTSSDEKWDAKEDAWLTACVQLERDHGYNAGWDAPYYLPSRVEEVSPGTFRVHIPIKGNHYYYVVANGRAAAR